jgi:acetolactate synthase-1/2/3 large subunit
MPTGAEIIWRVLEQRGVDVVFGYPGGAILPTYDAALKSRVRHVLVRHEQGAAHMADGYARASGRVGVALATSGPGATNLITGIATAMMDSSPLVCITGQVPTDNLGRDAFQETDVVGLTEPITKHNRLVTRAGEIGPALVEAFEVATSGRPGPVVVDITKDAQLGLADFLVPPPRRRSTEGSIALHAIEAAAELIAGSSRPLILAGQGIVQSGASELLRELAEKADLPLAPTLLGLGALPASHPLNLGMMGMHGESWVNDAIQRADLLIALGMRFDDRVTGKLETYAKQAKKIHIDIDPAELGKNVEIDVGMAADLVDALTLLVPRVEHAEHAAWREAIGRMRLEAKQRCVLNQAAGDRLRAPHVIEALRRATDGAATIVTDVGQHQMWAAQYYPAERPRQHLTSGGLGTMGFALPAAIGARFARPEEEIWVIAGDGGFQMTAAELAVCAQERLELKIAIVNNGYLGMVRQWQEFFYGRRYAATPISSPDFVKLAEAHGLAGLRVQHPGEMAGAIADARSRRGTVLIDFAVEQEDSVYPMVAAGRSLDDMIRRPAEARRTS